MPDESLSACRQECQHCHEVCLQTIYHCLTHGGRHADPAHIRLLADCMEICETSAHFLLRASDLHFVTCRACAEICTRCAESCEQFAEDDEAMRKCAEVCRACARECEAMSGGRAEAAAGGKTAMGLREVRVPSSTEIAALAEQLHAEAGRPLGRDHEFWYQAETRLRSPGKAGAPRLEA